MTQEQRVTRGSIVIFILSIVLLVCLFVTTTLAYFAGTQKNNVTLILGGPVRVTMIDNNYNVIPSNGKLSMTIKTGNEELLPGMGIDIQTIAHVTSSQVNSTRALLRAKLDISVVNELFLNDNNVESFTKEELEELKSLSEEEINRRYALTEEELNELHNMISQALAKCLTYREDNVRDGWVLYDGDFYYCSKNKGRNENGQEYIQLLSIDTSDEGTNITFINGTFQFPTKYYTNKYAHAEIHLKLTFEAIQEVLVDNQGNRIPNTLENVKTILDNVDWDKHDN